MISPMRPKVRIPRLDTYTGPLPVGWHWQPKIDDERAIVVRQTNYEIPADRLMGLPYIIHNRHGHLLAAHKAPLFREAAERLLKMFPTQDFFDCALIGFRGHWAPGAIVLLDIPDASRGGCPSWVNRYYPIMCECDLWDVLRIGEPPPTPGRVYRLRNYPPSMCCPQELFYRTEHVPGVEGLIGRDPGAPYQFGDSDRMCKSRWK